MNLRGMLCQAGWWCWMGVPDECHSFLAVNIWHFAQKINNNFMHFHSPPSNISSQLDAEKERKRAGFNFIQRKAHSKYFIFANSKSTRSSDARNRVQGINKLSQLIWMHSARLRGSRARAWKLFETKSGRIDVHTLNGAEFEKFGENRWCYFENYFRATFFAQDCSAFPLHSYRKFYSFSGSPHKFLAMQRCIGAGIPIKNLFSCASC